MEFVLPDLGEDAGTSAKVTFWYKNAGDEVELALPRGTARYRVLNISYPRSK